MDRLIMPESVIAQLRAVAGPVKIVDAAGKVIGEFSPPVDNCPFTDQELAAMRVESGEKSLDEIWKSLGAK